MPTKGEAARARLVETAANMFWRTSYHATSMNEVCRAAKVNKATAYEHFASKLDLVLATIEDNHRRTLAYVFDASLALHTDSAERLAEIFERVYATHAALKEGGEPCPGCPFVNIGSELAAEHPQVRAAIEAVFADYRSCFERIVRGAKAQGVLTAGASQHELAAALVDLMNGAMIAAKVQDRPRAILDAKEIGLALLKN